MDLKPYYWTTFALDRGVYGRREAEIFALSREGSELARTFLTTMVARDPDPGSGRRPRRRCGSWTPRSPGGREDHGLGQGGGSGRGVASCSPATGAPKSRRS
jgi:hypothetical protein